MHTILAMLTVVAMHTSGAAPLPSGTPDLVRAKAQIMAADYRGDLVELARLRAELDPWPEQQELAYLAAYWRGFASWRIAINGASRGMKSEDLANHLKVAAADLFTSVRLKQDFADAYAAASMVSSWLAGFSVATDPAAAKERLSLARALQARAQALDPRNPRVLWARGAFLLFAPESAGGSIVRAIDVYREMLDEADRRPANATSPLPDWGKPEALMSLAFAHLTQPHPDLTAARREAAAALELQPAWSYVRDDLLKQIDERLRQEH